ncbi:MAG: MATE family efflux transporter [Succinivibrio sp.]|nr:MATE family efflux transporter [Succinivibrio sp.]
MIKGFARYVDMDMLHGSLWDKIIVFSLPLAFTTLLQQFFNSADVIVLGYYIGDEAMAAVGNNIPIIGLIVTLFTGLSLGANVVVARYIGMGSPEEANKAVHTALMLAIVSGLFMTVAGELCVSFLISLLGVPPEVAAPAKNYLRIYLLGTPFLGIFNFEAALFRSKGNTATPLKALFFASILNVTGNIIAVDVLSMKEGGVAVATVLANLFCAGYLFYRLTKEESLLKVSLKKLKLPEKGKAKAIIYIGVPAGVQGMVFSLSNLVIQSAINSLGAEVMAASAIAFTIESFIYSFVNSFGLAATTCISQNYGALNLQRCRKIFRVALGIDFVFSLAIVIPVLVFAAPLVSLFTSSQTVIALTVIRVWFVVCPQPFTVLMEIASSAMRGYGYSLPPAIVTLIGVCGQRLIWVYTVFPAHHDFGTLMATYPISWFITTLLLVWLYIGHQKIISKVKS